MGKADNLYLAKVASSSNLKLSIGQFLDDFRRAENKYALIIDEPVDSPDMLTMCLLASIAHKLANDNGIEPPQWVFRPLYILPLPVYAHNTKNVEFQKYLAATSPPEFAERNIFYGANVIARV
ncbi:MAG: hypothetical protein LBD23_15150 [Oscillospiraceae bacterium]|jgi:hypothetical protein|nr:hypothetical protein [Oscillospiraceae bacterium]